MSTVVDSYFDALEHPLKDVMLAVRRVIVDADDRISESIKWKSPTFEYRGNLASINPRAKSHVSLMFHTGAQIPGDFPYLTAPATSRGTCASRTSAPLRRCVASSRPSFARGSR